LRLHSRRGANKAILAAAASMLMWDTLKSCVESHDLGADRFAPRDPFKAIPRLVRQLNDLGCNVQITLQRLKPVVTM